MLVEIVRQLKNIYKSYFVSVIFYWLDVLILLIIDQVEHFKNLNFLWRKHTILQKKKIT